MEKALTKAIQVLEKVRKECGQSEADVFIRTEIQEALALLREELEIMNSVVEVEDEGESFLEHVENKL